MHVCRRAGDRSLIVSQFAAIDGLIEMRDKLGRTALMHAAECGNKHVVTELLFAGADLNAKDDFGNTALRLVTNKLRALDIQGRQRLIVMRAHLLTQKAVM